MIDDGYCKIFVYSNMEASELRAWVNDALNSSLISGSIETPFLSIDVHRNVGYHAQKLHQVGDGFLYYPLFLDVFPGPRGNRDEYIAGVSQLLQLLWQGGMHAVAACDFEEELPRSGGMKP